VEEGWKGVKKYLYFVALGLLVEILPLLACLSMARKVPKAGLIFSGKLWKYSIY